MTNSREMKEEGFQTLLKLILNISTKEPLNLILVEIAEKVYMLAKIQYHSRSFQQNNKLEVEPLIQGFGQITECRMQIQKYPVIQAIFHMTSKERLTELRVFNMYNFECNLTC